MKKSLKATSIIESIVVLIVVVIGIIGVYNIMISSQRLSNSTADRIEAIQIARDGLEAFTNIRDTNWQLFAADYENCWNTLNYSGACIGDDSIDHRIRGGALWPDRRRFLIYKNINNQFVLEDRLDDPTWFDFTNDTPWLNNDFKEIFRVGLDANGFYTQWSGNIVTEILPVYTRTLHTNYVDTDGSWTDQSRFDDKIILKSKVEWYDPASNSPREVELSTVLTNWKEKQ